MNLLQRLRIPWYSTHRAMRWASVAFLVMCAGAALAIGVLSGKADAWIGAAAAMAFGLIYLWAFFLSTSLLLAIDARQLRMPRIQRQIVESLVLHAVSSIGVSTALLLLVGAPLAQAASLMALCCAFGLTFALMPRYVAVFTGLTPSLLTTLWRRLQLPGIEDPRFVPAALLATVLLIFVIGWYWRRWLRAGAGQSLGWASPMVLQFRHGGWGRWNSLGETRQLRQRPDWLQPKVDVDHAGPAAPHNALRVALGGWYLPQTARSYARQLGLLLGIVALPILGIVLINRLGQHDHGTVALLEGALFGSAGGLLIVAGPMIAVFSLIWIARRWKSVNAELPLLALLPGLGAPARVKREVLRAGLGLPLSLHTLLILLVGVAMLCWHGHAQMLSFMLLAQFGAAAVTTAVLLGLLGGRSLAPWATASILGTCFVLTFASVLLPAITSGGHAAGSIVAWLAPLALAWLLLAAGMAWLALRGWRGLARLPHPFLAQG